MAARGDSPRTVLVYIGPATLELGLADDTATAEVRLQSLF
jgi:hypothetical protein